MSLNLETDVLIIGAGPSGTVAASILHQAGISVQVVEKMLFPRFVIGESLLPRCMDALKEAKFIDAIEAKGFQKKLGAQFVRQGVECDFTFEQQFTKGWGWTWQVPRSEFDKTLADTCESMGIPISFETEVTGIEIADDESSITTVKTKDGQEHKIRAKFIIDGSGYGRVIPRLFNLEKESNQAPRQAVFCHIKNPNGKNENVDNSKIVAVVHNDDTWIWMIPFSNGFTSVGYVSSPDFFKSFEGAPLEQYKKLVAADPIVAAQFEEFECGFEPRTLRNWSSSTDQFFGKGFVLTGNVTEFLDPIFSSGVTLATVSAQTAAKLVIKKLNGENIDWKKDYQEIMEKGISVFRTYVDRWYDGTLYKIFFAENRDQSIMEQICSVLAGYVWDMDNPFVARDDKNLVGLAKYISTREQMDKSV